MGQIDHPTTGDSIEVEVVDTASHHGDYVQVEAVDPAIELADESGNAPWLAEDEVQE
jgi:hypothetical protein